MKLFYLKKMSSPQNHIKIIRSYNSEDNLTKSKYSRFFNAKKQKRDEELIINEIFRRKIQINFCFFKKNIITFMPRRCQSFSSTRKKEDLLDYDNEKMKFDEWIICYKEENKIIEEGMFKLLQKIFDRRYKLHPNNMCPLSPYAQKIKSNTEILSQKYNELSIYILYTLRNQFTPFYKYIDSVMNFKELKFDEYDKIKEILYYIGKDLIKVFKSILDNSENFKFNSILINCLEDYLVENKIKQKTKEKNVALYNEKIKFDNYLKTINNIFFRKDDEIIFKTKMFQDNEETEKKINTNILKTNENEEDENKDNNGIKSNENEKDNKNSDKNNRNDNDVENYNIDDLMNYINDSKNEKNKKKKKKKKKSNNNNNNNIDKKNENTKEESNTNINEDTSDSIFSDYKKSIEEYTKHFLYIKKIIPNLSDSFLQRLESESK